MSRNLDDLLFDLKLVDNLVGSSFEKADMSFYFAGGSACILAGWIDRTTRDFDFVDLGYAAKLSKVLKLLEPDNIVFEDRKARYEQNLVVFRSMFGMEKA